MKTPFEERIKEDKVFLMDGSMGAVLIQKGVEASRAVYAAIEYEDIVKAIHTAYLNAGCEMIVTNTFALCSTKTQKRDSIIKAAVNIAKQAAEAHEGAYIGLDVGPTGMLKLKDENELYDNFADLISKGAEGCDAVVLETFGILNELKIAARAAAENSDLPVIASMCFNENGRSWFGDSLDDFASCCGDMGLIAAGMNCSITPDKMSDLVKRFASASPLPVIAQPNRGMPVVGGNEYKIPADEYAKGLVQLHQCGARLIGGCCGADEQCMILASAMLKEME